MKRMIAFTLLLVLVACSTPTTQSITSTIQTIAPIISPTVPLPTASHKITLEPTITPTIAPTLTPLPTATPFQPIQLGTPFPIEISALSPANIQNIALLANLGQSQGTTTTELLGPDGNLVLSMGPEELTVFALKNKNEKIRLPMHPSGKGDLVCADYLNGENFVFYEPPTSSQELPNLYVIGLDKVQRKIPEPETKETQNFRSHLCMDSNASFITYTLNDTVRVMDTTTGKIIFSAPGFNIWVLLDGKSIAYQSGPQVTLVSTTDWKKITDITIMDAVSVFFSWNTEKLAIVGNDLIQIWQVNPRLLVRQIDIKKTGYSDALFSKDSNHFMILGKGILQVVDLTTGDTTTEPSDWTNLGMVRFDNQNKPKEFELENQIPLLPSKGEIDRIAFSADSQLLNWSTKPERVMGGLLYNICSENLQTREATCKQYKRTWSDFTIREYHFLGDDGNSYTAFFDNVKQRVSIWKGEERKGTPIFFLTQKLSNPEPMDRLYISFMNPIKNIISLTITNNDPVIFNYQTGETIKILDNSETFDQINDFILDISAASDGKIAFQDPNGKQTLYTLKADTSFEKAVFSPDRKLMAALMGDGSLRIWGVPYVNN